MAARLKLRLDAAWGAPGRGSPAAHWGPGEAVHESMQGRSKRMLFNWI